MLFSTHSLLLPLEHITTLKSLSNTIPLMSPLSLCDPIKHYESNSPVYSLTPRPTNYPIR